MSGSPPRPVALDRPAPGYVLLRSLVSFTIAVLFLTLPIGLDADQRLVGAVTIFASIPAAIAIDLLLDPRRGAFVSIVMHSLIIVGLTSAMPVLWHAGLVIVACLVTGVIPIESPRITMAMTAMLSLSMGAIGWAAGIELWYAPVLALMVVAPSVERFYRDRRETQAETDRRYDTLVETAGMFFWEVDPVTGRILSLTGNTERPLGRTATEVLATNWFTLADRATFERALEDLDERSPDGVCAIELRHADGRMVPFRHRIVRMPSGLVHGAAMEITELVMANRVIKHQAEHDGLTGLITRSVLLNRLADSLERRSDTEKVAVLMVDLQRFEEVNDLLGNRVGDRLLTVLARRFEHFDTAETVARMGADEFAILLVGDGARRAEQVGEEVVEIVEQLIKVERMTLSVSASVGVAVSPDDGVTAEVLLMRADTAMYEAKRTNRQVARFAEVDTDLGDGLSLGERVSGDIVDGRIELWFQPKVDLATGRVIGAEGLARWRHPDLGVLTPDRFLPVLAVSGAYHAFTDEVLAQGISFAATARRQGSPLGVAVNLSAMSFLDHGLARRISAMLEMAQLPPEHLTLEITESEILVDLDIHQPVFDSLRALGVTLSIDDFGVGYSSLSRLRHLPVQELKIDRSFVMGMLSDPEDLMIVKSIVGLADVLGHVSVAEGVEQAEEAFMLREMGCDLVQGYYFGRPMPSDEFFEKFPPVDGRQTGKLSAKPA